MCTQVTIDLAEYDELRKLKASILGGKRYFLRHHTYHTSIYHSPWERDDMVAMTKDEAFEELGERIKELENDLYMLKRPPRKKWYQFWREKPVWQIEDLIS